MVKKITSRLPWLLMGEDSLEKKKKGIYYYYYHLIVITENQFSKPIHDTTHFQVYSVFYHADLVITNSINFSNQSLSSVLGGSAKLVC